MITNKNTFLPYGHQTIGDDDINAVVNVLKSDWLTTGPITEEFEKKLAEYAGAKYAVACSSGTAGLMLCYKAIGLSHVSNLLVPTMTFAATANTGRLVGSEIKFLDCNQHNGLVDVDEIERILDTDPCKYDAIVPVHLNGQCADMERIYKITRDKNIYVIEDASHALGAKYISKKNEKYRVGSCKYSDLTVFSFHPVKNITMGEGGAVTTNNEDLYKKLLCLRNHGITKNKDEFKNKDMAFAVNGEQNPWYYEIHNIGYNFRASDLNCALGLSQLSKLDQFVEKRAALVRVYKDEIKSLSPKIIPIVEAQYCLPAWHLFAVKIDFDSIAMPRSELMKKLLEKNIQTQVHYIPVHNQPYYQSRYGASELVGSNEYYSSILSLPLFPSMNEKDVKYVVEQLFKITTA